jgi:hypothetical protein
MADRRSTLGGIRLLRRAGGEVLLRWPQSHRLHAADDDRARWARRRTLARVVA